MRSTTCTLLLGAVAISAWWLGSRCGAEYRRDTPEAPGEHHPAAGTPSVDADVADAATADAPRPEAAARDGGRLDDFAVDPRCAMTEVIGTAGPDGVAAELAYLRHRLEKPPLSTWTTFVRGATNRRGEPLHMVDDTVVRARIVSETGDRVRIELAAANRGQRRLSARVELEPGEPWLIVVGAHSEAVLVAVVECRP